MTARIRIPKLGSCPTLQELIDAFEGGEVVFGDTDRLSLVNFGHIEPGEDFRGLPWIRTDANRNPLGSFTYSATAGKWVRDWGQPVGAIVTVFRSAVSVSADRENKGMLDGWELADGTGITSLDLTGEKAYFRGDPHAWDVYTVVYVGH